MLYWTVSTFQDIRQKNVVATYKGPDCVRDVKVCYYLNVFIPACPSGSAYLM